MDILTDEQLIRIYLEGDEDAFRILIERYLKSIYNFVYRYVGNNGDAEDITQDAFLSAWKNIRKFDPRRNRFAILRGRQNKSFKTWIFSIAKNASLNWIKKKKPTLFSAFENDEGENALMESFIDPAPLPDEIFNQRDLNKTISAVIEKLSPNYRAVLFLRYNDQFTLQEISEILNKPLETVKSQHRRALLALKKLLIN